MLKKNFICFSEVRVACLNLNGTTLLTFLGLLVFLVSAVENQMSSWFFFRSKKVILKWNRSNQPILLQRSMYNKYNCVANRREKQSDLFVSRC